MRSYVLWVFAGKNGAESAQLKAMVAALKNKDAKKLKQKPPRTGKLPK